MILTKLYNCIPYAVSWSGTAGRFYRPNLVSYETDVSKENLGLNKLRRLVAFVETRGQELSQDERMRIRNMILIPNWNHLNYKMAKLAQRGIKILDGIEKQKTVKVVDEFKLDMPIDEFRLEIPPAQNSEIANAVLEYICYNLNKS